MENVRTPGKMKTVNNYTACTDFPNVV